jgi:hypothetical protein
MNRLITSAAALLLLTTAAQAQRPKFSIQGAFGFNGTIDSEAGGQSNDEDLESDLGLMASIEFQLSKEFRLGGRLAYNGASVDVEGSSQSGGDVTALDAGLWARFVFLPGKFEAFGAGGVGFSSLTLNPDGAGSDLEGTGFHFLAGVGASFPVAQGLRATGGLYYMIHNADLEADGGTEVAVSLNRALLMAGVMF